MPVDGAGRTPVAISPSADAAEDDAGVDVSALLLPTNREALLLPDGVMASPTLSSTACSRPSAREAIDEAMSAASSARRSAACSMLDMEAMLQLRGVENFPRRVACLPATFYSCSTHDEEILTLSIIF